MSRTDNTRPYWVVLLQDAVRIEHDHTSNECRVHDVKINSVPTRTLPHENTCCGITDLICDHSKREYSGGQLSAEFIICSDGYRRICTEIDTYGTNASHIIGKHYDPDKGCDCGIAQRNDQRKLSWQENYGPCRYALPADHSWNTRPYERFGHANPKNYSVKRAQDRDNCLNLRKMYNAGEDNEDYDETEFYNKRTNTWFEI